MPNRHELAGGQTEEIVEDRGATEVDTLWLDDKVASLGPNPAGGSDAHVPPENVCGAFDADQPTTGIGQGDPLADLVAATSRAASHQCERSHQDPPSQPAR